MWVITTRETYKDLWDSMTRKEMMDKFGAYDINADVEPDKVYFFFRPGKEKEAMIFKLQYGVKE